MSVAARRGPTAIVAALAAELAGVVAATSELRPLTSRRGWWSGRLGGEEVVLAATGDGAAAAAAGLEALLAAVRPRRLLVLGVSGGLTPGLAAGALIAARQVVAEDGSAASRPPDAAWLAQAVAGGATAGTAVSTRCILAGPAAKQAALRRLPERNPDRAPVGASPMQDAGGPAGSAGFGELPAPYAVDLESMAYATVAAAQALPYLVVRAVLDPVEETLPLDFEACRTAGGRVSSARVVLRALAHPAAFAALWRLRGRLGAAGRRLAELAERLVAAAPDGAEAITPPGAGRQARASVTSDVRSWQENALATRRRA